MHPPLARVAVALGPFLAGIRWNPQLGMWAGGNAILAARNQYLHNLALARAGVLPFFVICAFLTSFWLRRDMAQRRRGQRRCFSRRVR
jgi:hypothetical protein